MPRLGVGWVTNTFTELPEEDDMQRITVKSVKQQKSKDGSKTFWILEATDGATITSFDSSVQAFTEGTELDVELFIKGQYVNLTNYEVVAAPSPPIPIGQSESIPPTKADNSMTPEMWAEKEQRIIRQSCLKVAAEYCIAKGDKALCIGNIIITADLLSQYVNMPTRTLALAHKIRGMCRLSPSLQRRQPRRKELIINQQTPTFEGG